MARAAPSAASRTACTRICAALSSNQLPAAVLSPWQVPRQHTDVHISPDLHVALGLLCCAPALLPRQRPLPHHRQPVGRTWLPSPKQTSSMGRIWITYGSNRRPSLSDRHSKANREPAQVRTMCSAWIMYCWADALAGAAATECITQGRWRQHRGWPASHQGLHAGVAAERHPPSRASAEVLSSMAAFRASMMPSWRREEMPRPLTAPARPYAAPRLQGQTDNWAGSSSCYMQRSKAGKAGTKAHDGAHQTVGRAAPATRCTCSKQSSAPGM